MKTLLINGSPREDGNTAVALNEIAKPLETEGCVFDDDAANTLAEKMAEAGAVVVGSPVYYGQPNGALLALLQPVCFSASSAVSGKPVATVAVCRRGGAVIADEAQGDAIQARAELGDESAGALFRVAADVVGDVHSSSGAIGPSIL